MNNLMKLNSASHITRQAVAARLRCEWRLKFILLFVLNFFVYVPYLLLQRHHFFPATAMPLSFFDRLIPFRSETVWIYLSIYLLMPIGPFFMIRVQQILRYAAGIMLISLAANTIFLFWPTTGPRPDTGGTGVLYQCLVGIDNSFHAFPSLHAAFAVYSARCGTQVMRELNAARLSEIVLWLWAFLILFATLTTKQHVIADIVAGGALGFGVYSCVFNKRLFSNSGENTLQSAITNVNSNTL